MTYTQGSNFIKTKLKEHFPTRGKPNGHKRANHVKVFLIDELPHWPIEAHVVYKLA